MDPTKLLGQLIVGPMSSANDIWSAVAGDRIAAWRLKNAMKTADKVREEAKRRGIQLNMSRIPDRFAITWFEKAANEDQESIQELFAKLLAFAANDEEGDKPDHKLIEIISSLTPADAQFFSLIYGNEPFPGPRDYNGYPLTNGILAGDSISMDLAIQLAEECPYERNYRAPENLVQLGLLSKTTRVETSDFWAYSRIARRGTDLVQITASELRSFVEAVTATVDYLECSDTGRDLYNAIKA